MWKAEEDFPRGGTKAQTKTKQESAVATDRVGGGLRKSPKEDAKAKGNDQVKSSTKVAQQKQNEGDKRNRKRKNDGTLGKVPVKRMKTKAGSIIDVPLKQCLQENLCVLGCVRQALDYNVSISLPGNRVADLPITEISEAYTQQLKALAGVDSLDPTEDLKSLDEMFLPGMLIPVSIKSIEEVKGKSRIKLSALPSVINGQLPLSAVQDGMLLYGTVSSVEDHGYRVDLGAKGLQAFLTTKDAEKYVQTHHNGSSLRVGSPLWCVLKLKGKAGLTEGQSRVVNVTVDPDIIKQAMLSETSNLNLLLPGMTVKAKVERKFETGLEVSVFDFEGVLHCSQLRQSPMSYKKGAEVDVKVLYVHPMTKNIQLTAIPNIVKYDGGAIDFFKSLKIGNILEGTITRVERKKGVYFSVPGKITAFAAMSQLTDGTAEPDITKYEVGQKHQCRVLNFNFMEGVALVTLKESILKEKFLTVADLTPGDLVEATVKDVLSKGLFVKLSKGIFSFIPCMHLADVPIKHPEKKFEPGMKLKCRVLRADLEKSKVSLTRKKSLVKSKYPIISDYSQLQPHMELEGYILAVKENVVIVAFFNDVKGVVLKKDMSREQVTDPSTMFYVGQIIRCKVVYFNVEEKKLRLSFNFDSKDEKAKEPVVETQYELGQIISSAKIVRQDDNGFKLSLGSTKNTAMLPFTHLSDFHEIQELWKLLLRPGSKLDQLTLFHKAKKVMTMKESFLKAAQAGQFVSDFKDLKSGQLKPAVIKNHESYGVFLELAGGFTGLCPAKTLTNLQPSNLEDLFKPGQSVITRLSKIDSDKQRFLGCLRVDECYEGGLEDSMALLRNYLTQHDKIFNLLSEEDVLSSYLEVKVRDIVKVTISSVFKKGVLGELESGAKALATKYHLGGLEPEVGASYEAVVLFVDPLTPCVELTLEPKLVKAVKNRKENRKTQLKAGQEMKADVLLVKPEFLLMAPRAHGTGQFVYVPARKHMNDVERNPMYKVGTFSEVVIKETCGGKHLAVLRMNDPECQARDREAASFKQLGKHNIQPGAVLEAKVKNVHLMQMNIVAGGCQGRVHISEVADDLKQGKSPLSQYHSGQGIQVKVIGLREMKSQKFLPISRPKPNRSLLECTLKQSKINSEADSLLTTKLKLAPGDETWVYVLRVNLPKVWVQVGLHQQGYVDIFHLSEDVDILNNASKNFFPGTAHLATVLQANDDHKMVLSFTGLDEAPQEGGEVVAQVTDVKDDHVLVKLASGRLGNILKTDHMAKYIGKFVKCKVEKKKKDLFILSIIESDSSGHKLRKRKRKISVREESEVPQQKVKEKKKKKTKTTEDDEGKDSGVDVAIDSSESDKEQKAPKNKSSQSAPCLSLKGFSWEGNIDNTLAEMEENLHEHESDDDDDDGDNVAPESIKSKKKRKREEEKQIQEFEKSQLQGDTGPQSSSDFDRLVLQSPNSSMVWLAYIAHHVGLGELEKARAVAERALSTISFREEQEKQNVWLAYLNVETTYGDTADVKRLLERAVTYNDPLTIYLKQTTMYINAGKTEEAEQLFVVMTRKYKREKSVWKAYIEFLFRAERTPAARNLLQRCLKVLDKKDHVEVITKCANLEFSHGDPERGRTMFENLLASCPGRTDLWSVYVDMVVKAGDIEGARQLLERAVKQKLNTKKLSALVNKFIKFEETHGSEQQVSKVKEMAVTLFDS